MLESRVLLWPVMKFYDPLTLFPSPYMIALPVPSNLFNLPLIKFMLPVMELMSPTIAFV